MQKVEMFPNPDGSSRSVHYEGDKLWSDASRKLLVFLDLEASIVVANAAEGRTIVLDDDLQLQDHLGGTALQTALAKLADARERRPRCSPTASSSTPPRT